jgi:hypothetical protein
MFSAGPYNPSRGKIILHIDDAMSALGSKRRHSDALSAFPLCSGKLTLVAERDGPETCDE